MKKLKGSQEPRIRIEPKRVTTDGDDAAELMAAYGSKLDPWQKLIVDCWLGKDKKGNYTMMSAGLSVPRQNGKNVCLEAREFFGLLISGEKILHTAHQVKTAKASFRRLANIFTDRRHPEIMDQVAQIRYTNGEEAIELSNGGMIMYSARSRQGGRGIDGVSLLVYDEAQELTDEQAQAIMATLAASATGSRQIIYTGTPPYPRCPGDVFRARRTACLKTPGKHDAWHEWSVDAQSIDDIDTKSVELWYMTNPSLGIHLTEGFTAEEESTLSPDGFARERLGWWSPVLVEQSDNPIDVKKWEKCRSTEKKPEGKTAYGVKFTADGSEVVLCGAVCPAKGKARISFIDRRPTARGTKWLADWLIARYGKASCVVIDGRNGVDILIDRICETWKAKDSVIRPKAKDMVSAASLLVNEINEGTLTWYDGQSMIDNSAIKAEKRSIGGGWGFGGEDPAPIEACSLALWGARTSKRDPNRKMRIG